MTQTKSSVAVHQLETQPSLIGYATPAVVYAIIKDANPWPVTGVQPVVDIGRPAGRVAGDRRGDEEVRVGTSQEVRAAGVRYADRP
jgi:hypothetical protein